MMMSPLVCSQIKFKAVKSCWKNPLEGAINLKPKTEFHFFQISFELYISYGPNVSIKSSA